MSRKTPHQKMSFSGKHIFNVNAGYLTKAPSIRNTFTNARENHAIVGDVTGIDITEEKITSFDANYIFRSSSVKARLTAYYTQMQDANEISFYFADGISGVDEGTAFVQEILQGIDKTHMGIEFGMEAQITPTIKLTGVASVGQFTYDNNPNLVLTSSDFVNGLNFRESGLKEGDLTGQVFTLFILTVAAAEAAIGLAIIVVYYRNSGTIRVEHIDELKG